MKVELSKTFTFEAAHKLPKVPPGHKCGRLHGHSFKVEIAVKGLVDEETGWFIDFALIKQSFEPLQIILDHNYLNDIEGLENPTSENLARWIWKRIDSILPSLYCITIAETCTSICKYFGN